MEAILVTANNAAFVFKLKQPKKASIEKYEYLITLIITFLVGLIILTITHYY